MILNENLMKQKKKFPKGKFRRLVNFDRFLFYFKTIETILTINLQQYLHEIERKMYWKRII